jgi:amino acid adenylation domain-containing protein
VQRPFDFSTLVDLLQARARERPGRRAYTFLSDDGEEAASLTFGELDARARALGAWLQRMGMERERALLLFPPGLGFVEAFFGCLYAGAVAVPTPPPGSSRRLERLAPLVADARPRAVLAPAAALAGAGRRRLESVPGLEKVEWVAAEEVPTEAAADWRPPSTGADDLAFLQYTSGSTSTPKGVMVSHANLLFMERLIAGAFEQDSESVVVGWLPVYHDMGLIGNVLQPLWLGAQCVLMSPVAFLRRPRRWLEAISRYRATTSGGPNFAYELCVDKIGEEERRGLDLSSWRVAFNGAEPVRAATLERFARAFEPHGFRREALFPCYGLAEATLLVSAGREPAPVVLEAGAEALEAGRVEEGTGRIRPLVACGRVPEGQTVAAVDPVSLRPSARGEVGELWVEGPGVARGYWERPDATRETFEARTANGDGPFLRTGDLGFLRDGRLYVTGRLKDLIILRGRNHYPQDLELTAERSAPGLATAGGAAFSVEVDGEERLVVAQELEPRARPSAADVEVLAAAIRRAIAEEHEVQAWDVVLLRAGALPKTSSGKVQRQACRRLYADGALDAFGSSRLAPGESTDDTPEEETPAAWLRRRAAAILKVPVSELEGDRPLIDLGLDSLAAIELGQAVEADLGAVLPLTAVLEGAGVETLAGLLGRSARLGPPRQAEDFSAVSPGERGLWFLHRLNPSSTAYHLVGAARIHGDLPAAALRAAFQALADRHEALRTIFPGVDGDPVRRVTSDPVAFREHGAAPWDRVEEEAWRPFDLENGPLLRIDLFNVDGDRVLLFAVHHIAVDFWSLGLVARQLGEALAGRGTAGAPRPTDFVRWQEERLAGEEGERLWAYWSRRLANPPALDLPVDRPRPSGRAGNRWLDLDPELTARLRSLARERGATLYAALLAAFGTLLHRLTGQTDLTVGSPVAARPAGLPGIADAVGYFTTPVPLRVDLTGDPPFTGLLARTRSLVLEALDHQGLPYPLLIERLRTPLFRAMLVHHRPPDGFEGLSSFAIGEVGGRLPLGPGELESLPLARRDPQFDLTLTTAERRGGIGASLVYDDGLLDEATAARWLGHFETLLRGIAEAPGTPISELPLLTPAELRQVLDGGDGRDDEFAPLASTLHEGFDRQAERTPEAVAVIWGEERTTYRELRHRANRLAHHLRSLGAGPETVVGVHLERTTDLVTALLGVLKAGAAYLPLDPAYPAERIELMLADAGACLRIGRGDVGAEGRSDDPAPWASPGNLAYLIYTSGSTGRPKGVAIEHASATRLVSWAAEAFGPEERAGMLASTSINFDLSVFELFVPLTLGGTVILADNALALPSLPAMGEVTLVNTVPSAMAGLLELGPLPPRLRTVCLAGEPLRRALSERVYEAGVERVWNLYGPSEDTTYSTGCVVGRDGEPTIGRPVAASRAYVVDRNLHPSPPGVPGELLLGGGGLARGYLGRPELTAERFIPDPFGEEGARLYRTGDLVRRRQDGELEFLGRLDHQVKLRGYRIEPGEVEAALLGHPWVREAVVVARVSEGILVAYLAPAPEAPADPAPGLRAFLQGLLPAPFVPSAWVVLPALPRTPNGKVDRAALPAPDRLGDTGFVPPRGPVEELLAAIWADLLGVERIGRDDDFFERGGHSLLAARVVARVREALGVEIPLDRIFAEPTLAGLALLAEEARTGAPVLSRPIVRVPRDLPLPLSFAQRRIWFLDRLEPQRSVYNLPLALHLRGRLDAAAIRRELAGMVERHEALRTTYSATEDEPVQRIGAPFAPPLPRIDLSGLPRAIAAPEAVRLESEEARRPFDLERGPVLRALLLAVGTADHRLVLSVHHIAADGWSLGILLAELGGRVVPAPPVQPADHAVWQREAGVPEELIAEWRQRLAEVPALDLPTDRPRPAHRSGRGRTLFRSLPATLAADLAALGRARGATLFMLLLAGFDALLYRLTGQTDLAVGTVVAGRDRVELEGVVGCFINTLVLRTELPEEEDLPFTALLAKARETALWAYQRQGVPFERLIEELRVPRDASRPPLVSVLLALQNAPLAPPELPGLEVEAAQLDAGAARLDLSLSLRETGAGIEAALEYSTDLFDSSTVDRLWESYGILLAGAAADPGTPVGALPLLGEGERHQVTVEWAASRPLPDGPGVLTLFEERARRSPEAIALEWNGEALTYRELNRRANGLAWQLREQGVAPGAVVGLRMERSLEMVIGLLGIWKAGGAYLPLDPSYPEARLDWMIDDAAAAVVLTDLGAGHRTDATDENPDVPVSLGDPAYLIYTSGTTGTPKGVVVEHGNLRATLAAVQDAFGFSEGDRVPCLAPFSFDIFLFELLAPLLAGGTVELVRLRPTLDIDRLVARLGTFTRFHAVPTLMRQIVDAARMAGPFANVRAVFTGGDSVPYDLLAALRPVFPRAALHVLYGPTEATIVCTHHEWREGDPAGALIGRPFDGAELLLADRAGRPVPIGAAGEILIGGPGVTRGYLNRPEMTAERFPVLEGRRFYRSGDLARHLPDGRLEFLGRIDGQLKIRGFRIEPGEVESALAAHPGVREAVVLAREGTGGRWLAAYVVPEADQAPDAAALREALRGRLPEHMVPSSFAFLDALPVTAHGKVDRRALARIDPAVPEPAAESPRTPIEESLALLFADVLGVERVGLRGNFFDLGGHSLLATRLVSRVRGAFGVDLPLSELFEAPTVEFLAGRIASAASTAGPPLVRLDLPEAPLSFAQQRLWLLHQLEAERAVYNLPFVLGLRGRLDEAALGRALAGLVERHEALRTTFVSREDEPVQRIGPPFAPALPRIDLAGLPPALAAEESARLEADEARRPFDLESGPMLRALLLALGPEDRRLTLALHHIAADGWSVGVLLAELGALHSGGLLPEPPVQPADHAVWQREAGVPEELLAAWRERLADVPALDLPADRHRPAHRSGRGRTLFRSLPATLASDLTALGRARGATPFMVLLAGLDALLYRLTGQTDLAVGTVVAGRDRVELEGVVGCFINTLVLRTELPEEGLPFTALLVQARETALWAYLRQGVPFERLIEELRVPRDASRPPLVSVLLVLQNAPLAPPKLAGLTVEAAPIDAGVSRLDLSLSLRETGDGIEAALEWSTDLFDAATIERLWQSYSNLLAGAVADPEIPLGALPILGEGERHQVTVEWVAAGLLGEGSGVVQLFEERASRSPEAVALEFEGERLTFRELNRRANILAWRLLERGVRPGTPVGLRMERSLELVIGLLGIWKAGGAYLPLDPSYPEARLTWMIEDAAARLVLTDLEAGEGTDENPPLQASLGDPAYLIYTSGTTGTPKAVLVEHGNLRSTLGAVQEAFGFSAADRMPCLAPFVFDIFLFELLGPLLAGGTAVLVPARPSLDVDRLVSRLGEWTAFHAVPALMRQIVDAARVTGPFPDMRAVFTGGDAVPPDLLADLRPIFPGARLLVLYGPTEAAIVCAHHESHPGDPAGFAIGRPFDGVELLLVDRVGRPVPIGAAGEILIGGPGVARGYLNRPELTAERFVEIEGRRFYRSGDLARHLPDGRLEFLGRTDAQVKIRGIRVEPGEVEAALAALPGVREAVVLAREGAGGRTLAAYVVPEAGAEPDPAALREALRRRLPEAMVPSGFAFLEALPLTSNGKVDRRALARIDPAPPEARTPTAPRTALEETLAALWADVLGVGRVGVQDDFFDLGGHSLLATRLVSRIRAVLGVEVPLSALFDAPTVAGLAAAVESAWHAGAAAEAPPLEPSPRGVEIPLSFSQERLWFLDRLEPGSAVYNMPLVIRLRGPLDAGALGRALGEAVRRHEALRTVFRQGSAGPVQVVLPAEGFVLPVLDISEEEVEQRLDDEARRPFDLEHGPVLRALLLRVAPEDHLLAATLHHIAGDAWSLGILVRELAALYGGSALPELPVQYADYALWQRSWLAGEVLDAELSLWRERLQGLPPRLDLPADRPRAAAQPRRGASHPVRLDEGLTRDLKALARGRAASLFMALVAGFQALLARLADRDDLAIGTPVAGRTRLEVEGLIGFFVNTLVLRADFRDDPDGATLLTRTRDAVLWAQAHQHAPFEKLVEALTPERDLAHTPLFQAMIVFASAPPELPRLAGLEVERVPVETGTAKFDLLLELTEEAGGLLGSLEYDAALFDAVTIDRFLGAFATLLAGLTANPGRRAGDLPLLGDAEQQQLLVEWNSEPVESAWGTLHEGFLRQAERTPDTVALIWQDRRLTYGELRARVLRLARRLRGLGVGPEIRVGVRLDRTADLPVALLGVLAAGGAYVPLDPTYPEERLAFLAADAEVRLVLTREDFLDETGDSGPLEPWAEPGNLAYLIYTSGSTGRPKAVAIEHASAVRLVAWAAEAYGPDELAGVLASTSINFDLSVFELFVPLSLGGTVILADNALALPTLPAAGEVTLVNTVPSAAAGLLELGSLPPRVRTVNLAGEPLRRPLAERVLAVGVERLWNLYGPSEDTTYSTGTRVETGPAGHEPTIGRPVAGSRAFVVDRGLRLQPPGIPGELCLGGGSLARGYLGRPGLTAEKFVPDPFGPPGSRLYRTGDLARLRPDGALEYLGRLDRQVKLRGYRIEPGEIEAALGEHPAVREAAVIARDSILVGFLVVDPEAPVPGKADLEDFLRERLPAPLVPSAFLILPALPLTPNGKVDRAALGRLGETVEAAREEAGFEMPRGAVEETLAAVWSDLLGRERIGRHDSFFDLGGHSLLATRVVSRLRGTLGVEIPLRAVFETPTLAGLAARIAREVRGGSAPPAPPLVRAAREAPAPLSFAQQRLWFLDQLEPGSAVYNVPLTVRLRGDLDIPALAAALSEVVRRHEALRTTFHPGPDEPLQIVAPAKQLSLPVVDVASSEDEAFRLAFGDGRRPFDLERGPLFRAFLVRLAADDHLLALNLHHAVSDGWSLDVLLREVAALYGAFRDRRPSPLSELPIQYSDFALWQRQWLAGEVLAAETAFWREALAGLPPGLDLPADRLRPTVRSFRGGGVPVALDSAVSAGLRRLAAAEGATPFIALLAVFGGLLSRWSGADDLAVGSPVAGRTRLELEGLIGLFVNTLVLRADLAGDPDLREMLRRARETTLAAQAHQDLPFEKLVEELQPERVLGQTPLFQVVLTFQNTPREPLAMPGLSVEPVPVTTGTAKFDLLLALEERDGEIRGGLEWNCDLFDAPTIERLLGHWAAFLAAAVAVPTRRLSELPLLSEAERRQLLAEWSPRREFPRGRPLHALFEEQARRRPDSVAVTCGEERMTYGELDRAASQLARRLCRLGVGPEARVALFLERSAELIVALLGVLKAGGAYVPLDPDHPAERLAYLLDDSGARVLVTRAPLLERVASWPAGLDVLLMEEDGEVAEGLLEAEAGNAAYVIYTSGSTGKPKGVVVTHAEVARLFAATDPWFGFGPEDVWTMFHSVTFDFSVWEIWGALLHGGRLVVVPYLVSRSPDAILDLLERERVTRLSQTPSSFRQLVRADAEDEPPRPLALRSVVFGGEALDPTALAPWFARRGDERPGLVNMYGITETTVHVTYRPVRVADAASPSSLIGVPIPDLQLHLCDRNLNLVPVGVPGEICVGGAGLARGYLDRPDLTATRFVPDPFGEVPGARLYRSGDLARRRPNGSEMEVEYLGRIDHQIKIRGFRVELGEIEAALALHPEVREAAVLARDSGEDRRLVAYLAARGDLPLGGLRAFLRERLPEYMVPSAFVLLEALPLTGNGKLDRKALARIDPALGGAPRPAAVAPRTVAEEAVAAAWREVLGIETVGVDDNFFDLGGHSLLLVKAHRILRESFPEVAVVDLFQYPTVAALARFLTRERVEQLSLEESRERAESRSDRARQQRMRRQARGGR